MVFVHDNLFTLTASTQLAGIGEYFQLCTYKITQLYIFDSSSIDILMHIPRYLYHLHTTAHPTAVGWWWKTENAVLLRQKWVANVQTWSCPRHR